MQIGRSVLVACGSVAMIVFWASCTCDPVYPPEAGAECDVIGERTCDIGAASSRPLNVLVCVDSFRWQVETACDDFGTFCSERDEGPVCVERPCSLDEMRCTTDYTQVAICDEDGEWQPGELCDDGRICKVEDDTASCVKTSCAEGESRCSTDGKAIETCNEAGDWLVTEVCLVGEVCEVGTFVPICVSGPMCSEQNELEQRCSPDDSVWIQECQSIGAGGTPAYDWVDTLDCSTLTPDYICQQDPGQDPFCFPAP